jgi:hypothetical protein
MTRPIRYGAAAVKRALESDQGREAKSACQKYSDGVITTAHP